MAEPTRVQPIPRGQLAHTTASYFSNFLGTGQLRLTSTGASPPQIGLYNNSVDGSYLLVVGASVWYSTQQYDVVLRVVPEAVPHPVQVTPLAVNALMGTPAGRITGITDGADYGQASVWRFSGNGQPTDWLYDHPLWMLPPGWSIYTLPGGGSGTISAAFTWVSLKP